MQQLQEIGLMLQVYEQLTSKSQCLLEEEYWHTNTRREDKT